MANRNLRMKTMKTKKFPNGTQTTGIKKRLGVKSALAVTDARQKIIQKKRKNVVDARDILAKMAKTQDARNKINKLRQTRTGDGSVNSNVQSIGGHILRKTDRNGKISLVTNKSKQTTSNMNIAIQQQLGLLPPVRPKKVVVKSPLSTTSSKNSIRNMNPPVIRKTILNDIDFSQTMTQPAFGFEQPDLYRWYRHDVQPSPRMLQPLESRRQINRNIVNNSSGEWSAYPTSANSRLMHAPAAYVDLDAVDDEEMPLMPTVPANVGIRARLDSNLAQPHTHGILSQTKTKVVVPAGHRIVVSNLQSTVTQDDIRELFEDIGQLLVARLVRPGTAEVIYKNLKDAQKAVDTYHNRQLDGQPMKCLLVNKRPLNNPTAPAIIPSKTTEGILGRKTTSTTIANTNKLVPDLGTIHKVLFQRN